MAEIIGLLIVMATLLLMEPRLLQWNVAGRQQVSSSVVAEQAAIFNQAAEQYITQNSGLLYATATATTPVIVTVAQLEAAGLLPTTFSATNVYGQTWQLEVLQPTAGNLSAVSLTTGGTPLKDASAASVAQLIGAGGGFIPVNDSGAYPQTSPLTAYGTQGAWKLQLSHFSGVTGGELATYLSLVDQTGQLTSSDYLYRNAVPGNPSLNTMTTPLIMASVQSPGSACTTTGAIAQDGTGALLSCQSNAWTAVGGGYWKQPVSTYSALPASGNSVGDVRLAEDTDRAFAWTGAGWNALAVDQNGNLNIPSQLTVGGNANVGQTVYASTVDASNTVAAYSGGTAMAGVNSSGSLWADNGQFNVNTDSWGIQPAFSSGWSMVTSVSGALNAQAGAAPGSIHVNDMYDRATGMWFSQLASQVTGISNSLNSYEGYANSEFSNLQGQISNLNNEFGAIGPVGSLVTGYIGPVGPSTSYTWTWCWNRWSGLYRCRQAVTNPPTASIGAQSYAQLVTVAATVGMSSTGSSGADLCSPWGGSANPITLQAWDSAGSVLANQSDAAEPPNYKTYITWPMSITFIVPRGQAAAIELTGGTNGYGCGTFSYAVVAL